MSDLILDPEEFLKYYHLWCEDDPYALENLVIILTPLAEVMASKFSNDSEYRHDLIQECLLRGQKALQSYDPELANPHKYFTSVFYNRCVTCIQMWNKVPLMPDFIESAVQQAYEAHDLAIKPLIGLLERNRTRFPSIDANLLDDLTRFMYSYIITGLLPGKSKGLIKTATTMFDVDRRTVMAVYNSSLVWLRMSNLENAYYGFNEPDELSILYDLRNIMGDEAYELLVTLFSGISLKIPKD